MMSASTEGERRYSRRKATDIPVSFRILHLGRHVGDMRLSGTAEAHIRDLGPDGIGLEASKIIVDGLHIAQVTTAHRRPRVFLQCSLPDGSEVRATAKAVWCEQVGGGTRSFQIGLRFCEISDADRKALATFLHP